MRFQIVLKKEEHHGSEYSLYFYSEDKPGGAQNIGYIGEQLDLGLQEMGIGTLWYGMGKTKEKKLNGLDFVIMMLVGKVDPLYREAEKCRREDTSVTWSGDVLPITQAVLSAPSAVNSQPWRVRVADSRLTVTRYSHRTGIIPAASFTRLNRIDMGIFLCVLDVCNAHEPCLEREEVLPDTQENNAVNAVYRVL